LDIANILLTGIFNKRLFGSVINYLIKMLRCRLLQPWCYMAVYIQRHLNTGMTQPFLVIHHPGDFSRV